MPFAKIEYAGTPLEWYACGGNKQWDRLVLEQDGPATRAKPVAVFIRLQVLFDDCVGILHDPRFLLHLQLQKLCFCITYNFSGLMMLTFAAGNRRSVHIHDPVSFRLDNTSLDPTL
ncbi:hypothetical protein MBLNU13_g00014t1 [Cladosporium sp. NU13]